ncbi:MAG: Nif3-like dinuclear metal center hexameric protein [Bacteroidales bacterium]|nr:Nif3-like dinuclear metal center hexameric protein [Bacteroidales bacterium]
MKIREVLDYFERVIPLEFQESYDNSGLQTGNPEKELRCALLTLDVTEKTIEEAHKKKCNLIISHHPLIFHGLKKISGATPIERIIEKAIKSDISIYAAHTCLDNNINGLNSFVAQKMGIKNIKILSPSQNTLKKLVVFCPIDYAEKLRKTLFEAGAGHIGNYDSCSFNVAGTGSFRAGEGANPFVGETNMLHFENEIRIETIFPGIIQHQLIQAMLKAHPYEEVAYDIYPLDNFYYSIGSGIIGELEKEHNTEEFLLFLKDFFKTNCLKHNKTKISKIKTIAFCGGSGSFLINKAIEQKADIFITADLKYHDFQTDEILLADSGHYETEIFAHELITSLIIKKFPTFAFLFSENISNPVSYI